MRILIFTQDKELLNVLRVETKGLLVSGRQEAKIFSFYTLDSAINELKNNCSDYNLLVLDIDNIQDIKQIYLNFRIHNLLCSIIIISSSYRQLDAAMLLRPTAYLKKPLSQIQYSKRLGFVLNEFLSFDGFFSLKQKQKLERIPYCEIEYFESNQRNITVYLKGNNLQTFTAKLNDIEDKVPIISFVRCHQSYLVNMENIRFLDKVSKQFHMISGKTVDISRRNLSEVSEKFDSFMGRGR